MNTPEEAVAAAGHGHVLLIHGLFMKGWAMIPLRRRLTAAGFVVHCFTYPSVRASPAAAAQRLRDTLDTLPGPTLHFVAHSLGGLVLRHYLDRFDERRPGRVVTLGTPNRGSEVARRLAELPPGRWLLGRSIHAGLLGNVPDWPTGRDVGGIAGNRSLGLGRLVLPALEQPNDGTVSVAETWIPGLKDHLVLPVTHTGLLLSPLVAQQTAFFLNNGRFRHGGLFTSFGVPIK